jgi:polysaccharide chain length determinant protein (PEP-CTERM system associated)
MAQQKDLNPISQALDLWEIVLHYKWVVMLIGVLLSSAAVIGVALMPNYFSSSITVLVDPQKIPDRYVSDSVTMDQLRFDTLSQQILSATRLQQVIDELHLYPELQRSMTRDEIIEYMRKNITIQERQGGDRNMSAFTITYKGKDRMIVAQVATRLADSFIRWDLGARERQATETSKFLETQLAEAKREMDEQDAKLSEFKMQHLGELPDQSGTGGTLARLQSKLQVNTDALNRLDGEKLLALHSNDSGNPQPENARSERQQLVTDQLKLQGRLDTLRSHYSDEYPEVIQATLELENVRKQLQNAPADPPDPQAPDTLHNARLEVLSRDIAARQEEQKHLLALIERTEAKEGNLPLREQQLTDLIRDSQSARAHYQSLVDKTFSADIATDLERKHSTERFMVLDPARVPEKPIKPNRMRLTALLIPCCFLFSAGSVIAVERTRGRIHTEHELKTLLPGSVGVMGRIPLITTPGFSRRQMQFRTIAIALCLVCSAAVGLFLRARPHV